MSNHVLDKAYQISGPAGVESGRVVVRGATPGECRLPDAANAGGFLGVTMHAQARPGRFVAIRRLGIAPVVAAGPISAGDRVCIADNQGRVAALSGPRFETGVPAQNNALAIEWIAVGFYAPTIQLDIVNPGDSGVFTWSFTGGNLRILLPHNGEELTMTALGLKAAVEADPVLSRLIRVTLRGGNGTGIVINGLWSIANADRITNPIGVAEQPATQAGDLIDVFLAP